MTGSLCSLPTVANSLQGNFIMRKQATSNVIANGPLQSVSVVDGSTPIRFSSDIAFDIETAPLQSDADDGSLLRAESARVGAIGYYQPKKDRYIVVYDENERAMLQ